LGGVSRVPNRAGPAWAVARRIARQTGPRQTIPASWGDKDAILTALGNTAQSETLVVVASTDEHGATVRQKRIREQLERSERLRHNCAFKVNSVGLKLPAADCQERVEKLVQEVADGIVEITMTTLRRGESSTN
jgi:hypothetical protein